MARTEITGPVDGRATKISVATGKRRLLNLTNLTLAAVSFGAAVIFAESMRHPELSQGYDWKMVLVLVGTMVGLQIAFRQWLK